MKKIVIFKPEGLGFAAYIGKIKVAYISKNGSVCWNEKYINKVSLENSVKIQHYAAGIAFYASSN